MKEALKSYKLWLIVSITLIITIITIIISFSGNYHELEDLRGKSYEDVKQRSMIASLADENSELKKDTKAVSEAGNIDEIIKAYVTAYYNLAGTESENQKALQMKPYVTEELYSKMYDPNEQEQHVPPAMRIIQTGTLTDTTVQVTDPQNAKAIAEIKVKFFYPDGTTDDSKAILKMEFRNESEWKLSGVSSSNIDFLEVWR